MADYDIIGAGTVSLLPDAPLNYRGAFSRAWTDSAPAGTVDAGTIDTEIQHVRQDIRERIQREHLFPSGDVEATGSHLPGSGRVYVGPAVNAAKNLVAPSAGYRAGRMHYATDTKSLHIAKDDTNIDIIELASPGAVEFCLLSEMAGLTLALPGTVLVPTVIADYAAVLVDFSKFPDSEIRLVIANDGPPSDMWASVVANRAAYGWPVEYDDVTLVTFNDAAIIDGLAYDVARLYRYSYSTWYAVPADVILNGDHFVNVFIWDGGVANNLSLYKVAIQIRRVTV
jgi:hypothetical protein